ncbi:MAG: DNA-binding protein [Candidatus Helarchaeota archaeon]|nr:DNA-binding protein [Candidatus Helarchaeota archaeon]
MKIREIGISRMLFIKLEPGDDILESLTQAVTDNSIKTGFFTAIGAINQANIGFYLMDQKKYQTITFQEDLEILSCIGDITLKDGSPVVHAHLVVADHAGHAFGGHLLSGCQISVTGEVFLVEAKIPLIRKPDEKFQSFLISLD